jgi:hypothetical protein
MQRALNACAVVITEIPDAGDDIVYLFLSHLTHSQLHFAVYMPRITRAAQVEHHLKEIVKAIRVT